MNRFCVFVGATVFGWAGWWLGARADMTIAFIVSSIGSLLGVYVGWRINRDYLS